MYEIIDDVPENTKSRLYYKQCKLKKGDIERVTWLPEQFAILNKVLLLSESPEKWTVIKVYETRRTTEQVNTAMGEHRYIKGNWSS